MRKTGRAAVFVRLIVFGRFRSSRAFEFAAEGPSLFGCGRLRGSSRRESLSGVFGGDGKSWRRDWRFLAVCRGGFVLCAFYCGFVMSCSCCGGTNWREMQDCWFYKKIRLVV